MVKQPPGTIDWVYMSALVIESVCRHTQKQIPLYLNFCPTQQSCWGYFLLCYAKGIWVIVIHTFCCSYSGNFDGRSILAAIFLRERKICLATEPISTVKSPLMLRKMWHLHLNSCHYRKASPTHIEMPSTRMPIASTLQYRQTHNHMHKNTVTYTLSRFIHQ